MKKSQKSRRFAIVLGTIITIIGFAFQLEPLILHKPLPEYGVGLIVFAWTFFISMLYNEWAGGNARQKRPRQFNLKPANRTGTQSNAEDVVASRQSTKPHSPEQP